MLKIVVLAALCFVAVSGTRLPNQQAKGILSRLQGAISLRKEDRSLASTTYWLQESFYNENTCDDTINTNM